MKLFQLLIASTMLCAGINIYTSDTDINFYEQKQDQVENAWELKYKPLDFLWDSDRELAGLNDLTPSTTGFYNGDMTDYKKKLNQQYKPGSCIAQQCRTNITKDDSLIQKLEHYLQDICTQEEIRKRLLTYNKTLLKKQTTAKEAQIYWYGWRYFLCSTHKTFERSKYESNDKIIEIRTQEYVKLKHDINSHKSSYNLLEARNDLVKNFNEQNQSYRQLYLEDRLKTGYNSLDTIVQILADTEHDIHELEQEAQRCKRQTLTFSAMTLTILASVGGYYYSQKK